MAKKTPYTSLYDGLPKIVKVLIQLFLGAVVGGVYRIVRYFETKNVVTLVAGLLTLFTVVGNAIAWVVDLVTMILDNKISVLAD